MGIDPARRLIAGGIPVFSGVTTVANSGDNTVSLLNFRGGDAGFAFLRSSTLISGIPSPFAVACGGKVITSPSDNSISFIDPDEGILKATVKVGSQPYSASCFASSVFVSNYGDNSISVVDANSFTVSGTIRNVPGCRCLKGMDLASAGGAPAKPVLWVAGTDANVVTIIDPSSGAVITSIPVHAPSLVSGSLVGSVTDNRLTLFDASRLTVLSTIDVPTPRSASGGLVTTGAGNSVVLVAANGTTATYASGIPGASGIASAAFGFGPETFLFVTSPDSNRVFLIQSQPPTPSQFRTSNGASFGTAQVAPGTLASVLGPTGATQNFTAGSAPLPNTLGGVTLTIGGSLNFDATAGKWSYSSTGSIQSPLLFVGTNQVNFQVPPGIAPGSAVPAQITRPDGTTLLTTLNVTGTAPGIFTALQNGQGQGAVLNQDNSRNFGTNPAPRGSVVQIFATGGGDTAPLLPPGAAAPGSGDPLALTNVQPTVTIGGQAARVIFSGMAPGFVGLWQINAEVPQNITPGPAVSLVISAGGFSSNTVTIAVE